MLATKCPPPLGGLRRALLTSNIDIPLFGNLSSHPLLASQTFRNNRTTFERIHTSVEPAPRGGPGDRLFAVSFHSLVLAGSRSPAIATYSKMELVW
jgi:hypothetical protein